MAGRGGFLLLAIAAGFHVIISHATYGFPRLSSIFSAVVAEDRKISAKASLLDLESKILGKKKVDPGTDKADSSATAVDVAPAVDSDVQNTVPNGGTDIDAATDDNEKPVAGEPVVTTPSAEVSKSDEILTPPSRPAPEDSALRIEELVKMGWKESEAASALSRSDFDVEKAAAFLEAEEEEKDKILAETSNVLEAGWSEDAAKSALLQTRGNVTSALAILDAEEASIVAQFEGAVKDMIESGWDEVVSRQALMAQWGLDQRKAIGVNNTVIPRDVLDSLRPTLKQRKTETQDAEPNAASSGAEKKPTAEKGSTGSTPTPPKPAKKEDCVFDVTVNTFQKIVLESPVPVVLDVYADWCGPCKQLGPILEDAAMRSGGMFRLAKVNSDAERAIAETLDVTSLPTVFAVNKGAFTDRFLGMLPQEQLQKFLVRTITGYGSRVQNDLSDKDLADLTAKIRGLAGMASIDFKRKAKLFALVDGILEDQGSDAWQENGALSLGVRTAVTYVANAAKDVENTKFRRISLGSKAYKENIAPCSSAVKLLEIAGFRLAGSISGVLDAKAQSTENKKEEDRGEGGEALELAHRNSALLTLVTQRVADLVKKRKFSKINAVKVEIDSNRKKSFRSKRSDPPSAAPAVPTLQSTDSKIKKSVAADSLSSSKNRSTPKASPSTAAPTTKATTTTPPSSVDCKDGVCEIKKQQPIVKKGERETVAKTKTNTEDAEHKVQKKSSGGFVEKLKKKATDDSSMTITRSAKKSGSAEVSTAAASGGEGNGQQDKGRVATPRRKPGGGGVHTLHSTGIVSSSKKKSNKHNEYFGGDSTVTLAGDDDEEEENDDKDE